ncbi:hypothetical protein SBRCBS47491_005626 [Sporothrix bragantina]|uniref:Zn(2)-C6 fungal-type domain-containing protein n=1 Tax=Sporothrix bragantina TaxID=671064 RepID=A0ABP0BY39_9PEZI
MAQPQTATPVQSPPQPPQPPSKRCSMACTTCRQVKLRCDAAQTYPNACTRCAKRRKTCVFDAEFKRRPVRGALEKLMEEKEQLKQMVDYLHNGRSESSGHDVMDTSPSGVPVITPSNQSEQVLEPAHEAILSPAIDAPGYDLDGVRLSFAIIDGLFQFFLNVYHPLLPILDIASKSPAAVCADSELLFWTIVITAAQNHPTHLHIFPSLTKPYRRLLADALVCPARTVYMTQSLLVLTTWPLPVEKQRNDPSWYYCGMAASSALHLRLHEAEALWWYSSVGGREEVVGASSGEEAHTSTNTSAREDHKTAAARYKTWLGALVVSNTLAVDMGLPPPMAAVTPLAASVQAQLAAVIPAAEQLPDSFMARLELQTVLFRSYTVLKDAASMTATPASFPARNPLIEVLERELDAFEQKWSSLLQGQLPFIIQMDLLAARLRLRAPLLISPRGAHLAAPDVFVEAAWQKTVHYSSQVVHLTAEFLAEGSTDGQDGRRILAAEKRCLPKHYYRSLLTATFALLIHVMLHPRERETQNNDILDNARAHAIQAIELLQSLARHPADEHGRCVRFLRLVAHSLDDASLADAFARELAATSSSSPAAIPDIIEVGIKASWAIRQRLRRKYLDGPDRDLPRQPPSAATPAASTNRRTIVTRSAATQPAVITPVSAQGMTGLYESLQEQQEQQPQLQTNLQQQMDVSFGVDQSLQEITPDQTTAGMFLDDNQPFAQPGMGFSDELFTDWNAWFDNAGDFMNLFRAPT